MGKLTFTKIKNEKDKPVSPSPAASTEKREGVPGIEAEKEKSQVRGVPDEVRPSVGFVTSETHENSDEEIPTVTATAPPTPKRGPGRPPGSGKKQTGTGNTSTKAATGRAAKIANYATQIQGIHAMIDVLVPGMAIENAQAQLMGEGVLGVMEAYNIEMDPRITSLLTLAGVVGIVEMPKVPIIMRYLNERRLQAQRQRQQQAPQRRDVIQTEHTPTAQPIPQSAQPIEDGSIFNHMTDEVAKGNQGE